MAWLHPPTMGRHFSFLHIPSGRCGHSTSGFDGSLYLFGGFDGSNWLSDLHIFNLSTMIWSAPGASGLIPQGRQYHSSSIQGSSLFIFGGYNGSTWLNDLFSLEIPALHWKMHTPQGTPPAGREGHSMVSYHRTLYVYGGWNGSILSDFYSYANNRWTQLEVKSPGLCGHSMTLAGSRILIFGGFDGKKWVNSLFSYNIKRSEWQMYSPKNPPCGRGYHSAVMVNKYLLVYAGYNGKFLLGDLAGLDTENMVWSLPDPCIGQLPPARNAHTMTVHGSEVYVFGGYNGSRDTNDMHVLETSAISSLHDDLNSAYKSLPWKDLKIVSSTGECFVHSVVVKYRCPAMYALMQSEEDGRTIDIGNASQVVLDALCEYLYSDLYKEQSPADVLILAIKFDLFRLIKLCFVSLYQNQQSYSQSTLALDIAKCMHDEDLTDLNVLVDKKLYRLHKVIMAARSPYFSAMLQSGMKESMGGTIELKVNQEAFESILQWIYSDKFPPLFCELDIEAGAHLLHASNLLGIQSLTRMTEIALTRSLTQENAISLFESSFYLGADLLKSYCANLILRDFEKLMTKGELSSMDNRAFTNLKSLLPQKMRRQVQNSIRLHKDLNMVKLESQTTNQEPVIVKGLFSIKQTPKSTTKNKKTFNDIFKKKKPETKMFPKLNSNFVLTGTHRKLIPSRSLFKKDPFKKIGLNICSSTGNLPK